MSVTKRFLESYEEESSIKQKTALLYEDGQISGSCLQGIVRQIIEQGHQKLTPKQRYWFEKIILPLIQEKISDCEGCGESLMLENAYMNIEDLFYWCSKLCYEASQH